MTEQMLCSGRVECPYCHRKGVGYAGHPHATGHKDFARARCRYCRCEFKTVDIPGTLNRGVGKLIYIPEASRGLTTPPLRKKGLT
jgi:hypothetical protein